MQNLAVETKTVFCTRLQICEVEHFNMGIHGDDCILEPFEEEHFCSLHRRLFPLGCYTDAVQLQLFKKRHLELASKEKAEPLFMFSVMPELNYTTLQKYLKLKGCSFSSFQDMIYCLTPLE